MKWVWFLLITSLMSLNAVLLAVQIAPTDKEIEDTVVEAYIYAYPIVTMDLTKQMMTNVVKANNSEQAPINQFAHLRQYPHPNIKIVTAPNSDTLYSIAWLDLSKGPLVIHVPDEGERYYLLSMLDYWTNVFFSPGSRTTGEKEENFVIAGPNWNGHVPDNLKLIKAPTNTVWIIGRTYTTGTPEDFKIVHALQDKYTITPLSNFGKPYTPPDGTINPNLHDKGAVRDHINALDGKTYFIRFSQLLKNNPPPKEDAEFIARLAKIGIVPGQDIDFNLLDPRVVNAIVKSPILGIEKIISSEKTLSRNVNGWDYFKKTGRYGTDYLDRALITFFGLGANLPQDALYPLGKKDSQGHPLTGKNHYVIHFNKGELPPVKGFWSLTMYDDQYFFVPNLMDRYSLSPREHIKENADGSIDLYIQNESPGKDKESNWLPAPKDGFVLMFRFYWPEQQLIDGTWKIPSINKVQ